MIMDKKSDKLNEEGKVLTPKNGLDKKDLKLLEQQIFV